jgi:hypothetical protein
VRIHKHRLVPINRRVFVVELDMTGPKIRMVGVLVEVDLQISIRLDPIDAVVLVVDAGGVPEANF